MTITVGERLARIEEKLDHFLRGLEEVKGDQQVDHMDHETRIRSMEQKQWTWAGGITIVTLGVPYLLKKMGF